MKMAIRGESLLCELRKCGCVDGSDISGVKTSLKGSLLQLESTMSILRGLLGAWRRHLDLQVEMWQDQIQELTALGSKKDLQLRFQL